MTTPSTPLSREVPLTELSGDQLRARVARASLYLIYMNASQSSSNEPDEKPARAHAAYLQRLETEGRLFACGPVEAVAGDPLRELAIVAAGSRAEAERIAAADPLHAAGFRLNSVRGHTMNEGVACYVGRAMARRAERAGDSFDAATGAGDHASEDVAPPRRGAVVYLINLEPTDKLRPPEDVATMDAHFVWLRENEMNARLMSCGPVEPLRELPVGVWGGGLGVVATSRQEAEQIAAEEPSGKAGYRVLTVREWSLQHGLAAPIAEALVALNRLPA